MRSDAAFANRLSFPLLYASPLKAMKCTGHRSTPQWPALSRGFDRQRVHLSTVLDGPAHTAERREELMAAERFPPNAFHVRGPR